uniref:DUF6697 domain-containing protein n=1 Tax=Moniliophthora roreri TaxID=221103 RepID=A0A0W0GBK7_MONRR
MTKLHNNLQLQNFMFINCWYSSDAPKCPGGGGLFLDAENDPNTPDISIEINKKECDWVVVTQNGPNKWCLIGLVAVKGLPCLTTEEWKELGSEVHVSSNDLAEKRLPLHTMTKEQIEQAFNLGLIWLQVFSLQCISYPEEIQRQTVDKVTQKQLKEII